MTCEDYDTFISDMLDLFGISAINSSGDIQGARVYSVMRPPIIVPFGETLSDEGRAAIVQRLKVHPEVKLKLPN